MDLLIHADTTGRWSFKLPNTDPDQPHLLRLSAMLRGGPSDRIFCAVVLPPSGHEIEVGAAQAHGIEDAVALAHGRPLADVLAQFDSMARQAKRFIAYGADFALRVLDRAYHEAIGQPFLPPVVQLDLMREATPIVKVPRMQPGGGYAFPKLAIAYEHFTGRPFTRSADPLEAGADTVRALTDIMDGIAAAKTAAAA